jgi:uncharacterized protein with HEPN domain
VTRLQDYLGHILDALDRIQSYVAGIDKAGFLASQLTQDAVIRNIEIIGETGRNISQRFPEFNVAHPQLRLAAAYKMRNALSHGYFSVDLEIVWATVQNDLPTLQSDDVRLMTDQDIA